MPVHEETVAALYARSSARPIRHQEGGRAREGGATYTRSIRALHGELISGLGSVQAQAPHAESDGCLLTQ